MDRRNRSKESAIYRSDLDEPYMDYYDIPDAQRLNETFTWYPDDRGDDDFGSVEEEGEDVQMIEEFGKGVDYYRDKFDYNYPFDEHDALSEEKQDQSQRYSSHHANMNKRGSNMTPDKIFSYTSRLDKVANDVENNFRDYGMTEKEAYNVCYRIDKAAERLERVAQDLERDKEAITIEQDGDEPYLNWYNVGGTVGDTQDPDEPYMDLYNDDRGAQFSEPLEGETAEELRNNPPEAPVTASSDNWYAERKRQASTSSSSNWYEERKASQTGQSNWYEDRTSSDQEKTSGDASKNWYEDRTSSNGGNWYDGDTSSKTSSEESNWYEDRQSSDDSGNWYEGGKTSSEESGNWYE